MLQREATDLDELRLLGACLSDYRPESTSGTDGYRKARALFATAEEFSNPQGNAIWSIIESMHTLGAPLSRAAFEAEVRNRKLEAKVGAPEIYELLRENIAAPGEVEMLAKMVAEAAQVRRAIANAQAYIDRLKGLDPMTGARGKRPVGDELQGVFKQQGRDLEEIARQGTVSNEPRSFYAVSREDDEAMRDERSGKFYVKTHVPLLDKMLNGGMCGGKIYTMAGRPKHGKTMEALQVLLNMVCRYHPGTGKYTPREDMPPVYAACMEMTAQQLARRVRLNLAGITDEFVREASDEELDAALAKILPLEHEIGKSWVFPDDEDQTNLHKMFGQIRTWRAKHEIISYTKKGKPVRRPAVVLFDFLQGFPALPGDQGKEDRERIGNIVRAISELAKQENLIVILISQFNRGADDGTPKASQNEGSGAIEQLSWALMGVQRHIIGKPERKAELDRIMRDIIPEPPPPDPDDRSANDGGYLRRRSTYDDQMDAAFELATIWHMPEEWSRNAWEDAQRREELIGRLRLADAGRVKLFMNAYCEANLGFVYVQAVRSGDTGRVPVVMRGEMYRVMPSFTPRKEPDDPKNPKDRRAAA